MEGMTRRGLPSQFCDGMPKSPTRVFNGPSLPGMKIAFQMMERETTELTIGRKRADLTTFFQKVVILSISRARMSEEIMARGTTRMV
jgi:hypothetical protein